MKYIARRTFQSFDNPGLKTTGDPVEIRDKKLAQELIDKKLIYPAIKGAKSPKKRKTKEDKAAYKADSKVYIEHDAGPMFYIKDGDKVIDRLTKSKAEKLRDELNKSQ